MLTLDELIPDAGFIEMELLGVHKNGVDLGSSPNSGLKKHVLECRLPIIKHCSRQRWGLC